MWSSGLGSEEKIAAMKRQVIANILRGIDGLSVRQAAPITGLSYSSISRLRRGLPSDSRRRRDGSIIDHSLEALVAAAIVLGFRIRLQIGPRQHPTRDRTRSSHHQHERRPYRLPMHSKATNAKIRAMKRRLQTTIAYGIEGLSVRQAASVTGRSFTKIGKLLREDEMKLSLGTLVGLAIDLGFPTQLYIGAQPPSKILRIAGREERSGPPPRSRSSHGKISEKRTEERDPGSK
jgi:hypothetical protein